jgi:alpha-beta hydrolase superfamily lysophospholipase
MDRDHENRQRLHRLFMFLVYLAAIVVSATAMGQTPKPPTGTAPSAKPQNPKPPATAAPAPTTRAPVAQASKSKAQDPKFKPREVTLNTKDGIELRAFYFPSEKGKEAPTVLLIHEWQGQASPYSKLVTALNKAGCAVLVPDYRGHGGSREYTDARGQKAEFNLAQMSRRDVEAIIGLDLEKAKGFLKDENNDEMLNLNALVVIGVGEGCVMAAQWAMRDWAFPSVGRVKQGQDVKALVLISPEKQVKGIPIDPAATDPNLIRLPMMIVAGTDSPEAAEANRLAKRIEGLKTKLGRGEATGFQLSLANTELSGPSLVNDFPSVIPAIVKFVTSEVVVNEETNPWVNRK